LHRGREGARMGEWVIPDPLPQGGSRGGVQIAPLCETHPQNALFPTILTKGCHSGGSRWEPFTCCDRFDRVTVEGGEFFRNLA